MIRLLAILGFLVVGAPASAATPWPELRRDLHLPTMEAGEPCRPSAVDDRIDWMGLGMPPGVGRGPVYPGVGGESSFPMTLDEDTGRRFQKLAWLSRPSYTDRALVRGRRIDGPGRLSFGDGTRRELRVRTYDGFKIGVRGMMSFVLADEPGCYAMQIDGAWFSRVVVFRVRFA